MSGSEAASSKTLYIGGLGPVITEGLLSELFSTVGPVENCKLMRDKNTGLPSGYGFVEFYDHATADNAIKTFNGRNLYGQEIRVNWAYQSAQREDTTGHYHLFVGDLSPEVDDMALFNAFSAFGSLSDARVLWDALNNRSRGYGFVAYRKKEDAERAMVGMNGEWLGSRAVRVNWASQKGPDGGDLMGAAAGGPAGAMAMPSAMASVPMAPTGDETNTSVYIGGITPETNDAMLAEAFKPFGPIVEVRVQRGFAFVKYQTHDQAKLAIQVMNGKFIDNKPVKCSWGKHKAPGSTPSHMGMGYPPSSYGYPYAAPPPGAPHAYPPPYYPYPSYPGYPPPPAAATPPGPPGSYPPPPAMYGGGPPGSVPPPAPPGWQPPSHSAAPYGHSYGR
eukprot:TRINITY_DN2589_c0_g1_i2.p1 TRINITY_DN2589_c0_g1~~TRINITY_DN2589_c0_g1_i2.p1  ORF type:complete len:390 (+),score=55.78 TRINITY_DN2589_c0_g1_i2:290-1459(+)